MVAFNYDRFIYLRYRHPGLGLQDLGDIAFVLGRQVENNDEGHAVVSRHGLEEAQQRVNPACGCAYPDDEEGKGAGDKAWRGWRELQNGTFVVSMGKKKAVWLVKI